MLILALQLSEKPDLFCDLRTLLWNSNIRCRYVGIIKNLSDLSICINIFFVINSFGLSKNTSRIFKFHFFFFKICPDIISVKFIFIQKNLKIVLIIMKKIFFMEVYILRGQILVVHIQMDGWVGRRMGIRSVHQCSIL